MQVFDRDCLVKLGSAIAPSGPNGNVKFGDPCVKVTLDYEGQTIEESVPFGSIKVVPIPENKTAEAVIQPARQFDAGKGYGHNVEATVNGGVVGVIIDCRGRPIALPDDVALRNSKLVEWFLAMNMYPAESLKKYAEI